MAQKVSISVLCCLIVLALTIVPSHGRPGSFRRSLSDDGICATSFIPNGYFSCQEIDVITEDGYILNVQRIPEASIGSEAVNNTQKKQPVLLQHGVLVDGMTWLLNSPEENLPMILADSGFDVWIVNGRGTRFSRRHISMDPSSSEFWDWTWDEIVTYDLPAVFNHIFNETGQKIDYVGHSQGTLTALASFSEGKLVNQLRSAALLSPVAYLSNITTLIGRLGAESFLGEMASAVGLAEFNPRAEQVENLMGSLCISSGIECSDLLTLFTGENCCVSSETVDNFLHNEPQSSSTKNMVHLSQTVRNGVLAKYDYGISVNNLLHYGQSSAPIYNLTNIPVDLPLFLSYGGQDALSDVADVKHLLDDLHNHNEDKITVQSVYNYAHADFIMANNAKDVVYKPLISFFNSQN